MFNFSHVSSLGKMIALLSRMNHKYIDTELSDLNFGPGQVPILMILYHHRGINQSDLAQRIGVDRTTIARTIKKLISEGLVERKQNPNRLTEYGIYLTSQGREIYPRVMKTLQHWTEILLEGFSKDEKDQLYSLLSRSLENGARHTQGETFLCHIKLT
ncbi:MAG: MarR family transcriptional regulator [Spirochaetes bacterium]|nr:MarR family transcriptional regulator [Spirochaetota bacterium]